MVSTLKNFQWTSEINSDDSLRWHTQKDINDLRK